MDQGMILAINVLYTQFSLQHLVDAMDSDENFMLKGYWSNFTITTNLSVIQAALKDIKKTLNTCWKVWPECVHDYKGFSPEKIQHMAVNKAVRLAKILGSKGFDDILQDDVNKLIDTHSEPLMYEDLLELVKSVSKKELEATDPEQEEEGLTLGMSIWPYDYHKELQGKTEAWDSYMVQSFQFKNTINAAMQIYKTLLTTMKKQQQQLPITMFPKPNKKALHEDTTPSKVPEEEVSPEEL